MDKKKDVRDDAFSELSRGSGQREDVRREIFLRLKVGCMLQNFFRVFHKD